MTRARNIQYPYTTTGQKLRKVSGSDTRDYAAGIEYNNDSIEFIQTEEGRAVPAGSSYSYEYMLKDHLGNTRATVKQDGSIVQVQDYYAFGKEMNPGNMYSGSPLNNYTYNGKEKQAELEEYDYGARFYDAEVGRWNVVDSLAEHPNQIDKSPYAYAWNNPVKYDDPSGKCPWCAFVCIAEAIEALIVAEVATATVAATATVITINAIDHNAFTNTTKLIEEISLN